MRQPRYLQVGLTPVVLFFRSQTHTCQPDRSQMTEIFPTDNVCALTGNGSRACTASVAQRVVAVAHVNRTLDRITRTLVVSCLQAFSKYSWSKIRRCFEENPINTIAVGRRETFLRLVDNIDLIAGSKDKLTYLTNRLTYQL